MRPRRLLWAALLSFGAVWGFSQGLHSVFGDGTHGCPRSETVAVESAP